MRGALLLALTVSASTFAGVIAAPFVGWDDPVFVSDNPLVNDPWSASWRERLLTPSLGYPMPLPVAIWAATWAVSHEPWLFHALNLGLHLGVMALVARSLREAGVAARTAATAALLFGVHPIVAEPVAWISALKDLLIATGAIVALRANARDHTPLTVAGLAVALASKPSSVLIPFALLIQRRALGPAPRSHRIALAACALAGVLLMVHTIVAEPVEPRTSADVPWSATRVLAALGLHGSHLLMPAGFSHMYAVASTGTVELLFGIVFAVAWLAGLLSAFVRRDPTLGWIALGGAAYLPASNLWPLHRFTADSFFYLPWASWVVVLTMLLTRRGDAIRRAAGRLASPLRALPLVVACAWALLANRQATTWSDTIGLWTYAHEQCPDNPEIILRLGHFLGDERRFDEERALYLANLPALEHHPLIPPPLPLFLEREGRLDEADAWYARAFATDVEQGEMLYFHFAEYAARHPERVSPGHRDALRHCLDVWARRRAGWSLDAAHRERLARLAESVDRADVAAAARAGVELPGAHPPRHDHRH